MGQALLSLSLSLSLALALALTAAPAVAQTDPASTLAEEVLEGAAPDVAQTDPAGTPDEAVLEDEAPEVEQIVAASALAEELPDDPERGGLEEIVVTAERRSSNLQKVPAAVTAFSGNDLLERGLTDFNVLQYNVPGLFSGGGLTKITLRGVGSEIVGPGVDPGFAVHINNVFSARETTGLLAYFDIERVDILRGPQGTLWGRNSTGGALNVITNRPRNEFDANGDIEYTQFTGGSSGIRVRGMINTPLVDEKLALRVAAMLSFADGYMKVRSRNFEQRLNDEGSGAIRASLRWTPNDDWTVDLIASYFRLKGAGPGKHFEGDYETPRKFKELPPTPTLTFKETPSWPGAGPGANFDLSPAITTNSEAALPNPENPYEGTANEPQRIEAKVWTATVLAAWEGESIKVDSITGYQWTNFFLHRDQDTSSLPLSTLDLTDKSMQISQEFLVSSTWDSTFNYTVGTNYQYDRSPRTEIFVPNHQNTEAAKFWTLFPTLAPSEIIADGVSLVDGCPVPAPNADTLLGRPGPVPPCGDTNLQGSTFDDFTRAWAQARNHVFGLFGNLTWEPWFVEGLTLKAGGRFSYTDRTWDDRTYAQTYSPLWKTPNDSQQGIQVIQRGKPQQEDWKSGTWKFSVDYELIEDTMIWSSVGTGSRAGGFNFSQEVPFGDERILAVEAGTKSRFFDRRLELNLAGFWYDWDDPQIGTTQDALPLVTNAQKARSYGLEAEFRAMPWDELILNGSFGWQEGNFIQGVTDDLDPTRDGTIIDWTDYDPTTRAKLVPLDGNRLPRTPRFTASFGAQYNFDLGKCGQLAPRVDFYFRDSIQFRQYDNPADIAPRYTRTDARVMWFSESEKYWMEVYARNLENNAVKTNQEIQNAIYRTYYYDPPRNGGVRFGYFFQ